MTKLFLNLEDTWNHSLVKFPHRVKVAQDVDSPGGKSEDILLWNLIFSFFLIKKINFIL